MKIDIDTREFERALDTYFASTTKGLAEVLNQRAFNIAARTMDSMKPAPGSEQAQRSKIKGYLDETISSRIRQVKSGKNKGSFKRRGSKANQLARVNLVIQARRAKMGLQGLYGQAMRQAEGKFKKSAQVGVGFLKSPYVGVIKGLLDYVKFRKVATRWGRISVWAGSKGQGTVNPAQKGWSPAVMMKMLWSVKGQPTKADKLTRPHLQAAFDAEGREMMRHVAEKLQEGANKINAK